jgi:hypothetical protein
MVEILAMTRVGTCARCGRAIVATDSPHCSICERILARSADDAFKRQARKEQVERQKREGGRPWRWR